MSALDKLIKDCRAMDTQTVCLTFSDIEIVGKATDELAKLRAKLEQAKDLLDQFTSLSAKAEFWLGDNPASIGMSEAEYKDYLSEQDRLKREAEEENQ